MGGDFNLTIEGAGVEFVSTLNGNHSVVINSILGDLTLGTVGDLIPIAGLVTSSGSGLATLNGDISTEGGEISFGQAVQIAGDLTIRTGLGLSPLGASVLFSKTVEASGLDVDLAINPGSAGAVVLGEGLGSASARFGSFNLVQGGLLTIGGSEKGIFTTGDINIAPKVSGNFPKTTMRFNSSLGNILLAQGGVLTGIFTGSNNNTDGSNFVANAGGNVTIGGLLDVSGGSNDADLFVGGNGYDSGSIEITAGNSVRLEAIQALGGDGSNPGGGGSGGVITIRFGTDLEVNSILADGGVGEGIAGGSGGKILITRTGSVGDLNIGTLASRGGDSNESFGGDGGVIEIKADNGNLSVPTSFFTAGGEGSDDPFSGNGGTVFLEATNGNLSFQNQNLTMAGNGSLVITAGGNIVLATTPGASLSESSGGVVLSINEGTLRKDTLGTLSFAFGGADTGGQFYMPASSYLVSNGGDIQIFANDPSGGAEVGAITISGITTSSGDLNGGRVLINQSVGTGGAGAVFVGNLIDTSGGTPTNPLYGRAGGQVLIHGTDITLNRVVTSGSASQSAATVPAFGGAGGDITVTASSTITLRRDIVARGGVGLAVAGGAATGGAGGTVQLDGNVVLNSGDATRTTIMIDTTGGAGQGDGDSGLGGNLLVAGSLTGTPTTSNTLDLRYGSGTVTLGDDATDAITLGTLITAADDAGSTGTLAINGELRLDTLTTFGRGYSIEILGNGSNITGAVTFLNTGYVRIGGVGTTVTFAGGFDALTGGGVTPLTAPEQVRLAGTIVSGDPLVTGSGASMLMGPVELVGNTALNSNVNEIRIGNVTGDFDLDLLADIGAGVVTFTGNVGTLDANGNRTAEIDDLFIRNGVTGNVRFEGVLVANSLTAEAATSVTLKGNTDLLLGGSLGAGSLLVLDNVEFEDFGTNLQIVNRGGTLAYNGAVTLTGGPVEMTGAGNFELGVLGTLDGDTETTTSQNLILSGLGAKDFSLGIIGGSQAIGSGLGAAITMSGGDVTFGALTTASGLSSTTANVIFNGAVTLGDGDTVTTLNRDVTFNNATFTSTDDVFFGDSGADAITLLGGLGVGGAADYTFSGALNGGFGITLGGSGVKTFESEVGNLAEIIGFTQVAGSGLVIFGANVETSAENTFNGSVTLSGISFVAGGATNLGDSSTDAIILDTAVVTLRGAGAYTVNGFLTGAQTLTLDDAGTKTFASTANIGGFTQVDGTGLATFQGNVTTSGESTFNSLVTLSGISFSAGGDTILGNAAGDTITLTTGAVTLGGDGAFTLNGAMTGAQALTLAGSNTKTFTSTVAIGNGTTAMTQANTAGNDVSFAENVTLNGASTFARQVTLDAMTVTASGDTSLNTVVLSGGAVTLQGAGAYTTSGAVTGAQNFTLSGAGTKTFASTITSGDLTQTGGQIRLGGNVFAGTVDLENAATTSSVTVNSGGFAQTYDTLTLNGNLTTQSGAGLTTLGTVGGAGSLRLLSDAVDLLAAVRNQGTFSAQTAGSIVLGGAYLSGVEVARIFSSGGASFISTGAGVTANSVTVNTGLSLDGATGAGVTDTTVNGALNIVARGLGLAGVATFGGTLTTARSLAINAASIESGGTPGLLDFVNIPSLGNITLTEALANFTYLPAGNLNLTGPLILNNGDIVLAPTGNFVNNFNGNPFAGATTRILTKDFFTYPNSAGVPGLTPVFGVTSLAQLGANQIGVAVPLLAGSAGPYITEFTTGTGQPYILATQENSVPAVVVPATYKVAGAFPARASYPEVELEMMTPEERSAYEAGQRRQSARVILERQPGQPEVGVPTEGEIPQAKASEEANPAPTAQVYLQGRPLAGKPDREAGDSTQLLRLRPSRVVSLRPVLDPRAVLENERLTAEVNLGAAPIARIR
jgi:hypothetical protein